MKIGLGTAQFGMTYGISNQVGKTSAYEANRTLKLAADRGIKLLDTAYLYGDSEKVLGMSLAGSPLFSIVTKTVQFKKNTITDDDVKLLENTFFESLQKLNQKSIYGLLIHNSKDILVKNGHKLWKVLENIKNRGFVKKIGVSLYSTDEIDRIFANYSIDLVQVPVNIFDQRLIKNGYLKKIKEMGIEIHSRSAFLQGLLLMNSSELPTYFSSIKEHFDKYQSQLEFCKIKPVKAALGFVLGIDEIDTVIVGVNHAEHLMELLDQISDISDLQHINFSTLAVDEESIINPSLWKIE